MTIYSHLYARWYSEVDLMNKNIINIRGRTIISHTARSELYKTLEDLVPKPHEKIFQKVSFFKSADGDNNTSVSLSVHYHKVYCTPVHWSEVLM